MTSFNSFVTRSTAAATIAALLGLTGCGPQSGAAPTSPAAPSTAVSVQQPPVDPAYSGPNTAAAPVPPPTYAVNNNGVPLSPNRAGQAVPVQNGYPAQPAALPTTPVHAPSDNPAQAYAPPTYAPPTQVAQQAAPAPAPRAANPALHGEVSGIEAIRARPQGSGAGAVLGGVLGAVVGNQFGHGSGRTALTVLGAGGGAVAGNNVERNMNEQVTGYRVSVRLDNGQIRTLEEPRLDGLRIGDRVRINGRRVVRG